MSQAKLVQRIRAMLRDDKAQRLQKFNMDEALERLEKRFRAENPKASDDVIIDKIIACWTRLTAPTKAEVKPSPGIPKEVLVQRKAERQAEKAKRKPARQG